MTNRREDHISWPRLIEFSLDNSSAHFITPAKFYIKEKEYCSFTNLLSECYHRLGSPFLFCLLTINHLLRSVYLKNSFFINTILCLHHFYSYYKHFMQIFLWYLIIVTVAFVWKLLQTSCMRGFCLFMASDSTPSSFFVLQNINPDSSNSNLPAEKIHSIFLVSKSLFAPCGG